MLWLNPQMATEAKLISLPLASPPSLQCPFPAWHSGSWSLELSRLGNPTLPPALALIPPTQPLLTAQAQEVQQVATEESPQQGPGHSHCCLRVLSSVDLKDVKGLGLGKPEGQPLCVGLERDWLSQSKQGQRRAPSGKKKRSSLFQA